MIMNANVLLKGARLAGKGAFAVINAFGIQEVIQLGMLLAQQNAEKNKELVKVPEIVSADYRLRLEDAERWLKEDGFKTEAVVVKPDVKYKDCLDLEVVATNYRINKKIKIGERVILKYVTTEVIEQSKNLFEESKKHEIEVKLEKASKKLEQKEKTKKVIDDTTVVIRDGVVGVTDNVKNQFKKLTIKHNKDIVSAEPIDDIDCT